MTNHPLGDELYTAYASGALSRPMRLLIDAQASVDGSVARQRAEADEVAGLLLEAIAPAEMSGNALEDIFAIINTQEAGVGEAGPALFDPQAADKTSRKAARAAGRALEELLELPDMVRDLALEKACWNFAGPGVRTMELMRDGPAKAELIRIDSGRGVPHHGHDGMEFTLVLAGGFSDGRASYGPGEVCMADPNTEHKPIADDDGVCIVLAVTDGPLAFTGPLGWIQRALGGAQR